MADFGYNKLAKPRQLRLNKASHWRFGGNNMTSSNAAISQDPADRAASDAATLARDGIVALKSAFSRDFVEAMREDMMTAFWNAIQRPGGAVGRGPRRWYV